ncbi:M15 family metallopeptidase [Candidatus Saccharibacteria bacterium]|nr:M15 family metallopeptidase [Candidatus Saccharibacteria bacterium]
MSLLKLKSGLLWLSAAAIIALPFYFWLMPGSEEIPKTKPSPTLNSKIKTQFNKQLHPTDEADSLWVVVNKGRLLPADYVPDLVAPYQMRPAASSGLDELFAAAAKAGNSLKVTSSYRSYQTQASVYGNYAQTYGQAQADTFSARPGHSEHQTGLAVDVEPADGRCRLNQCFGQTAEGRWLAEQAYRYGYIIRYPNGKQALTGFIYEPWHLRYVGRDLARQLKGSELTLEQFFSLKAYNDYPLTQLELKP